MFGTSIMVHRHKIPELSRIFFVLLLQKDDLVALTTPEKVAAV